MRDVCDLKDRVPSNGISERAENKTRTSGPRNTVTSLLVGSRPTLVGCRAPPKEHRESEESHVPRSNQSQVSMPSLALKFDAQDDSFVERQDDDNNYHEMPRCAHNLFRVVSSALVRAHQRHDARMSVAAKIREGGTEFHKGRNLETN